MPVIAGVPAGVPVVAGNAGEDVQPANARQRRRRVIAATIEGDLIPDNGKGCDFNLVAREGYSRYGKEKRYVPASRRHPFVSARSPSRTVRVSVRSP